jgi:hypothetical protein
MCEKLNQMSRDGQPLHWLIVIVTLSSRLPREKIRHFGEIARNVVSDAEELISGLRDRFYQISFFSRCLSALSISRNSLPSPGLQPYLSFLREFDFSNMVNVYPIISY